MQARSSRSPTVCAWARLNESSSASSVQHNGSRPLYRSIRPASWACKKSRYMTLDRRSSTDWPRAFARSLALSLFRPPAKLKGLPAEIGIPITRAGCPLELSLNLLNLFLSQQTSTRDRRRTAISGQLADSFDSTHNVKSTLAESARPDSNYRPQARASSWRARSRRLQTLSIFHARTSTFRRHAHTQTR